MKYLLIFLIIFHLLSLLNYFSKQTSERGRSDYTLHLCGCENISKSTLDFLFNIANINYINTKNLI